MHHRTQNLEIGCGAAGLRGHGTLAFERRRDERFETGIKTRLPGACIAGFGGACDACRVTSRALGSVDLLARLERSRCAGVDELEARYRLDTRLDGIGRH